MVAAATLAFALVVVTLAWSKSVPLVALALVLALVAAVVLIGILTFNAARGGLVGADATASPTATLASPAVTPSSVPTPVPTLDIGALPKPVRDQVEKYLDACGSDAALPDNLASMNKKAAEEYFEPLIEEATFYRA